MKGQEQFLPLENYRSEWDRPEQLEIFAEEAKAQIIDVFDVSPKDINKSPKDIEPLDINEL